MSHTLRVDRAPIGRSAPTVQACQQMAEVQVAGSKAARDRAMQCVVRDVELGEQPEQPDVDRERGQRILLKPELPELGEEAKPGGGKWP